MSRTSGKVGIFAAVAALALALGAASAAERLSPNAAPYYAAVNGAPVNWTDLNDNARQYNSGTAEMYASLMGASVSIQREFRRALPSIYNYSQTAHMQNPEGVSYCSPTTMCSSNSKWVMWDTPFMSMETYESRDGYRGYTQDASGFATGVSRLLGDTSAIGLAVGYDHRKFDSEEDHNWRERGDAFHAALYGGTAIGCFFVDGYAGYTRTWHRTERSVGDTNIPGTFNRNNANFNDTILSAGLKASYVWILPNEFRITPAIGLDYSHIRQDAFSENGVIDQTTTTSPNLLRVDKGSKGFLQMPITASVNKTFSSTFLAFGGCDSLWTPEIRAGWIPQLGGGRASVDARHLNGPVPTFTSKSTEFGGSYGTVGAGLKIKLRDKYIFAVDYDYYYASKYDNHIVTAAYGVSF